MSAALPDRTAERAAVHHALQDLRADDQNALALRAWVRILYIAAPSGSHGSPDKVKAWIEAGGVAGRAGRAS